MEDMLLLLCYVSSARVQWKNQQPPFKRGRNVALYNINYINCLSVCWCFDIYIYIFKKRFYKNCFGVYA